MGEIFLANLDHCWSAQPALQGDHAGWQLPTLQASRSSWLHLVAVVWLPLSRAPERQADDIGPWHSLVKVCHIPDLWPRAVASLGRDAEAQGGAVCWAGEGAGSNSSRELLEPRPVCGARDPRMAQAG